MKLNNNDFFKLNFEKKIKKTYNYLFKLFLFLKKLLILKTLILIFITIIKILISLNIKLEENKNIIINQKELNISLENTIFKRIKIGIYTYNLKNGGIQRISSLLINYLYKSKIFNLHLFSQNNKEDNEYIIYEDIKRILIKRPRFINLFKEIKKNKIDILIFQFPNNYGIKVLNKIKNTKIIFFQHYSFFYWIYTNYSFFLEMYKSYQNSKYIISMIPFENDYIFKKWGIRSILMNNFVTYEYQYVIPSDLSKKIIIMIGRSNDKIKRLELGLLSMEYIIKEVPEIEMKIISNITYNYNLVNIVNDLNLQNQVKFVGYTSTPEIYYRNSLLHIFPTISESFGLVLSETKIYGIPTILVGLDYVSISKGGTLIIYDDKPESISKVAINILKYEQYKKKLGKEGRISMQKFQNNLLLKKWIKLLLSIYKGDEYYIELRKKDINILDNEALNILVNQIKMLKLRIEDFKNITINDFQNFSLLQNFKI